MPESTALPSKFEVAYAALLEITDASTVGDPAGETDEGDGVVSVLFDSAMAGYPGWKWTVSVAEVEGEAPTALEVELMPAEGALLSPDWVPWSDRLADYKAAQLEAGEEVEGDESADDESESDDDDDIDDEEEDDDETDDDESDDEDEDADDVIHVVHGGDVDGVDIDNLDESDDDESN